MLASGARSASRIRHSPGVRLLLPGTESSAGAARCCCLDPGRNGDRRRNHGYPRWPGRGDRGCFGQCAAEIVGSRPVGGRASSEPPHQGRRQRQGGSCGNDQAVSDADGASAFEQGSVTPCRDSARPYRATGATSLRRSGLARERRGSGLACGFTAGAISQRLPSPPFPGPRSGPALCMPDAIGTTRMRTRAGRTGIGPTGASAPMPKIDIGAARIATGCTDESRCREPAVAQLAPQKAGLARPSDSSRTDFCGQDVCGILARALHRILGWPRRSTLVVSDRFRGIAAGQRTRSRQELLSHPRHHRRGACYDRAGIWAGPIRRAVRGRGRRMDLFLQLCRPCGAQFRVLWLPARRLHGRNRRHPGRPRAERSLSFGGGALHGDRARYHLCGACQSFDPGARALAKARRARARSDSPRRRLRNAPARPRCRPRACRRRADGARQGLSRRPGHAAFGVFRKRRRACSRPAAAQVDPGRAGALRHGRSSREPSCRFAAAPGKERIARQRDLPYERIVR